MFEVRIHEDVFVDLGNEVLCALHILRSLREAGVPVVGNIALIGVTTGSLQTWMDQSGLDGNEFVFLYNPTGEPPQGCREFRFHEDSLREEASPYAFAIFIERVSKVVPLRSKLSPHAVTEGVLTMYRDETLDGDEYVLAWLPNEEL